MRVIKEGVLVKAWDDDLSRYTIGYYNSSPLSVTPWYYVDGALGGIDMYKNAIEIPPELAKQLEELGG